MPLCFRGKGRNILHLISEQKMNFESTRAEALFLGFIDVRNFDGGLDGANEGNCRGRKWKQRRVICVDTELELYQTNEIHL